MSRAGVSRHVHGRYILWGSSAESGIGYKILRASSDVLSKYEHAKNTDSDYIN